MQKTPDEIKKALEYCVSAYEDDECERNCDGCLYSDEDYKCKAMMDDALAYIQQLEKERDGMLEEMRMAHHCCGFCKHNLLAAGCAVTPDPIKRTCFEWRGAKEDANEKVGK